MDFDFLRQDEKCFVLALCWGSGQASHLSVKSKVKHATFLEARVTAGGTDADAWLSSPFLTFESLWPGWEWSDTDDTTCAVMSGKWKVRMNFQGHVGTPFWSSAFHMRLWKQQHPSPTKSCGMCANWAALEVKGKRQKSEICCFVPFSEEPRTDFCKTVSEVCCLEMIILRARANCI